MVDRLLPFGYNPHVGAWGFFIIFVFMKYTALIILVLASCQKPKDYTCECRSMGNEIVETTVTSTTNINEAIDKCKYRELQWSAGVGRTSCRIKN